MREIKPTQKPVPSSDIKDLFFNSGLLDIWATSLERKYIDRFGNCHLTAAGMEWLFKELVEKFKVDMNTAIVASGYIPVDSFQQGADLPNNELTQRNHILRDETTGEYFRWDGDLPKQVLAGSTPESTGGIGKGAWVSVGDASTRSWAKENLAYKIESVSNFVSSEFPNNTVVSTIYHTKKGIGGASYNIIPISEYNGTPDNQYADFYTNNRQSVAVLRGNNGVYDITQLGCIPDGNYESGTGTDNTAAFSFLSLFAEKRGGASFVAHGNYKGKHKINRSNYHFSGTATIWFDGASTSDYTFELEAPNGANNFGPFLGKPWLKPDGIASGVTLHRVTQNVTQSDLSIRIDSTSGLKAGMTGIVISGVHEQSTENNLIPMKFQYIKIKRIEPNTIVIDDDVMYSNMDVTQLDTYFVKWDMLDNVRVTGVKYKNKLGANYLHRIGGCWDAFIDVTMNAQTACGAAACNRRLYYGVKCDAGYNGISTARMSQDITIKGIVNPVITDGSPENLGLFIEENPRSISVDFDVNNARAVISMLTEHTKINGVLNVKNKTRYAILFGSSTGKAVVDLKGTLISSATETVKSEYLGKDAIIRFNGTILNNGSGKAWDHNQSNSLGAPTFTGVSNADFESANYINAIKMGYMNGAALSKLSFAPVGISSSIINGGVISSTARKGIIGSVVRIETGKYRVNVNQDIGLNYSVSAASSLNGVAIRSKNANYFEVWCWSGSSLTDPDNLSVQVFI